MLLVVPKAAGIAVVRNKLRRRLKDVFRREALSQKLPVDLVFIARKPIMNYSFDELKQLMKTVIKKL